MLTFPRESHHARCSWWELLLVGLACTIHLALGFNNLGGPSIWHDEAVQVTVAKNLAATGRPLLPSGEIHSVAPVHDAILAVFIYLFGDGEAAVRAPSVLFGALNVLLLFLILRPLLGPGAAVTAAIALALSPWTIAWSRQARFYALQQTLYVLMLGAGWRMLSANTIRQAGAWAVATLICYLLAIGTALHSVIFVSALGSFAFLMAAHERRVASRWTLICGGMAVVGLLTLAVYIAALPHGDFLAVFYNAGIGLRLPDPESAPRFYYFSWLADNLSLGYFLLALLGFAWMWVKEGRRGLYVTLGFLAPVLVLTFLIAYRRHRFMYFAFPFYVAGFSYGAVQLAHLLAKARRSWLHAAAAAAIVLFALRLGVSTYKLGASTLDAASGADITLATRHPQWRAPCEYVREHLDPGTAVVTTTFMPVLYYIGRVDDWYPSLFMRWEAWETGSPGIWDAEEMADFMKKHPKGYFLAEWFRFLHFEGQSEDRAFVEEHMTHLEEACSGDVHVYAWGITPGE